VLYQVTFALIDDAAESFIVDVVVAPDDVQANHAGFLPVPRVAGAVEREILQRELIGLRCGLSKELARCIGDLTLFAFAQVPTRASWSRSGAGSSCRR
jgi:hypothetical protein